MIPVPGLEFYITLIVYILVFLIITLSYNMAYGYTGIPDFGRAMAAGAGGFLCGLLPGRLMFYLLGFQGDYLENIHLVIDKINAVLSENPLLSIMLLTLTVFLGACAGGALGLLASLPIFRGIRLFYLGVTLLAIQIGFNTIMYHWPVLLRGELGVPIPDPFKWLIRYSSPALPPGVLRLIGIIVIAGVVLLITIFYLTSVSRSPLGRVLKAIRDDETSVAALGRDVRGLYVKVMVVSYAFTGAAGAIFAFYQGYVVGLHFDRVEWTFWPIAMVILGGLANYKGTAAGTIFFITLKRLIIFYKANLEPILPFSPIWLESLLLGLILILVLIYRPRGLFPEKPEISLSREEIERIREKIKRKRSE
ncbi:MAG: branched-chain amino acid ABC transporter permease [Candidatus Bathyarchaeia archaeon]|nr:branched-chain amino acid ABC transporter permease [Candidatus Bathyarchaeota archaeon]